RGVEVAESYQSYALWRLGDLTGDTTYHRQALGLLSEAHTLAVRNSNERPGDTKLRRDAVDPLHEMAQLHVLLGEGAAAVRDLLASRPTLLAIAALDARNAEAQRDVAVTDLALA